MADGNLHRDRLLQRLRIDCGSFFMEKLEDPKVVEIMRNADGRIWLDVAGQGMFDSGYVMPDAAAESMLATCAGMLDVTLTKERPILKGEFPIDDSRLLAVMPPVAKSPVFALRKMATSVFDLEAYEERGMLRPNTNLRADKASFDYLAGDTPLQAIKHAIRHRANILVVGGTGSGKTTLSNAVNLAVAQECPNHRVITIEDTRELQMRVPNHLSLRETDNVSMDEILKACMRLRPDRIIVGEVRGREAYTLINGWNSGHPGGVATIHADSAREGLQKLTRYYCQHEHAQTTTDERVAKEVASAVQVVLFIESIGEEPYRAVSEICRVRGYSNGSFDLESI